MNITNGHLIKIQCPNCHNQWPYPIHLINQCPDCNFEIGWEQGIMLLGGEPSEHDYASDLYTILFEVEDRHFWFNGRNLVIERALRAELACLADQSLLEVGCGTG